MDSVGEEVKIAYMIRVAMGAHYVANIGWENIMLGQAWNNGRKNKKKKQLAL